MTAAATIVIALFTFTLWRATDKLWSAGEKQIAIARDSASAAQRAANTAERTLTVVEGAFIMVSDLSGSTIAQNGTIIDYRVHVNVLNSGRTVAKNYVSHVDFAVFDAIPENFRFPDRPHDKLNKNIIGPQSRTYFQIDFFIQDAIGTYEGRKKPLIYGWIEYDDIFPQNARHRCEFCMIIEVFADPRVAPRVEQGKAIPILTISPYGGYNAYDDECLYRPGETPIAEEGELPPLTLPPDMPGVTYRP